MDQENVGVPAQVLASELDKMSLHAGSSEDLTRNRRGILKVPPSFFPSNTQQTPSGGANVEEAQQTEEMPAEGVSDVKAKTAMCLMNELSRYNKVKHVYTLVDEHGPAHQKTFIVKLRVGEEEYTATGQSIKKAQHAAAAEGLARTALKRPPEKAPRNKRIGVNSRQRDGSQALTPTVELNALLMKRGEQAVYHPTPPRLPPGPVIPHYGSFYTHHPRIPGGPPQRHFFSYARGQQRMAVHLTIGEREFYGEGSTKQAAKHNAADKALKIMKALKMPEPQTSDPNETEAGGEQQHSAESVLAGKSAVSLLHEMAIKKNVLLKYEEVRETGPPHSRVYTVRCTCGESSAEAEGQSKRLAKKLVSEQLLRRLVEETDLFRDEENTPCNRKRRTKNGSSLVKEAKADVNYGVGVNPVSRLCQIQQSRKQRDPTYELLAERGLPRRNKEFTMKVAIGNVIATGTGPNKKLAKRHAAEAMLAALGYVRRGPTPIKSAIKSSGPAQNTGSEGSTSSDKRVTFCENEVTLGPSETHPAMRVTPRPAGVLYGESVGAQRHTQRTANSGQPSQGAGANKAQRAMKSEAEALAAKLLLSDASALPQAGGDAQQSLSAKEKLIHIADKCGFKVQFTEFPKNSSQEFLSLASLLLDSPQVYHGTAASVELSHNAAAQAALNGLVQAWQNSAESGTTSIAAPTAGGDAVTGNFPST